MKRRCKHLVERQVDYHVVCVECGAESCLFDPCPTWLWAAAELELL